MRLDKKQQEFLRHSGYVGVVLSRPEYLILLSN